MYEDLTHNDLVSIIKNHEKRLAIIKDDLRAIYYCIGQDESLKDKIQLAYGGYIIDTCLLNIDIACDLQSDECFEWDLYSNF